MRNLNLKKPSKLQKLAKELDQLERNLDKIKDKKEDSKKMQKIGGMGNGK